MTLPREWLAAALVGADRAPLPGSDGLPPALAALRAALDDRPPADVVLLMAGAAALYDDLGRLPARAPATEWHLPALRAEGERPPCSPAAALFLERMLNQQHIDLLPELLARIDGGGWRVADDVLPQALAHGARVTRIRPLLLPVLGERGRWLGAVNPAWRYAAVELDNWRSLRAAWEHDPPGRVALAQTVRARDAGLALRLIETTWRGETAVIRRESLAALEPELSPADEPFLERALDDLDLQVRHKAAALLAALPDSRLVARMIDAAGDILTLAGGHLTPRFPAAVSDALVRDGVTRPVGSGQSAGERTRLLTQIVGIIPSQHWEERLGATPEALVAAAAAGRWPRTLLAALATATGRHPDPRWLAALLAHEGLHERNAALAPLLPPPAMRARLAAAVAAGDAGVVVALLRRWGREWDAADARLLLRFLAGEAARPADTPHSPTLRFLLRSFARQCPPALVDEAAALFAAGAANKTWEAGLRAFVATLALRREIQAATATTADRRPPTADS